MGIARIALMAGAVLMLQLCESEDESEAVPSIDGTETVSVEADVDLPAAQHGGTVVLAGTHPVEVLPYEDGTIDAYVVSPEPPPPAQTQVTVHVPADDGERHPVLLVWDPSLGRYRGQLRRAHPAPGPVEVVVVHDGHRYRGERPRVIVVGPTAPAVVVEADAPRRVEVVRPGSPQVNVQVERPRPEVQVRVEAPRPRHQVVIQHPGPPRPSVRVEHRGPRVRARHDNGLHLGHRRGRGNVRVRARGPGRGGRARVRVR